jgi:diguanylate cyclase (GGDEF)-like protein
MEAIKITASLGVSTLRTDDTIESFVKRADDAMYKAKNNGRNQVALAK